MAKPIKLYGHGLGPNPWKVAIILNELNIPFETEFVDMAVMKQKPFTDVNVNGRVPAITDPNTGITLWESGAIIDYLMDVYDKDHKLSYANAPEKYYQQQWEHFQMSGQGPYFGQKAWFTHFHADKGITSAIERYGNEVDRVIGVIDAHLAKTGQKYLVGDKVTYADLMFIPWNAMTPFLMGEDFDKQWQQKYPRAYQWHQELIARPAVKKTLDDKAKKVAEG